MSEPDLNTLKTHCNIYQIMSEPGLTTLKHLVNKPNNV